MNQNDIAQYIAGIRMIASGTELKTVTRTTDFKKKEAQQINISAPAELVEITITSNYVTINNAFTVQIKSHPNKNASRPTGRMANKVVIVTGAAQGFGAGIVELLFNEGANVVIADLNAEKGQAAADHLNALGYGNTARFIACDVTSLESTDQCVAETVNTFGGIDLIVSNAGVLRAGSIEETDAKTFDFVTKVNYYGYFNCVKSVTPVMKIQNMVQPEYYADIIQINSKSGLKGSNKNFSYAGGKFGGIGLTESFALELAPYKIKVNSVCPGNFYEGPLWSDPVNGLFVQYLNAGKVPGAQSIEEVKQFYLKQVPLGKGCSPKDVVKAILYLVEQENETGQALPVSGGQEMLR